MIITNFRKKKMETSRNTNLIFSLIAALLLSLSSASSDESFLRCLNNHSDPSSPISAILYAPNNASYSVILQNYLNNLRFNSSSTPKPRFILTALHVSHVQAAVVCAKSHGLQIKIRSGGHDYEGLSYTSDFADFFILDMFNLRAVDVSVGDETAWVGAGAILGEVYYAIAEKSAVHAFPAGVCPRVGVGGHFGGGGYGNMIRAHGLSVDNIVDATMVGVDGRLLDRESMGEDLFWAITGGGAASFGVVVSYKIKLVRVPPKVTVFKIQRLYNENLTNLVYSYIQTAAADSLPPQLFIRMNLDVVNVASTATNRARFVAMFLGASGKLVPLLHEKIPELGLKQTDCLEMSWIESVLFWSSFPAGTPATALLNRKPPSVNYLKRKSDYLKKPIPKPELELILRKMVKLEAPELVFNPYGGRMAEIPPWAKPFPHRAGNVAKLQYATNWEEGGEEAANRYVNLTRQLFDYMTPYVSAAPREAFLNYRDLDIGINDNGGGSYAQGKVYGLKYFKENFYRLVKIKTNVDPHNFFRNEQSIPVLPS
ncbi:berberine bridge enzyme-like 8 [Salvia miltiorrhiza]|uniref:berberine bridge enzyme-like 8 n=1 Tax=Salvia miltiorrhiza TaxID=226208 RepID=UPI0025AC0C29|nr:berberine bridge enzyme-like 8 [Salvia miltiorrhiza]